MLSMHCNQLFTRFENRSLNYRRQRIAMSVTNKMSLVRLYKMCTLELHIDRHPILVTAIIILCLMYVSCAYIFCNLERICKERGIEKVLAFYKLRAFYLTLYLKLCR